MTTCRQSSARAVRRAVRFTNHLFLCPQKALGKPVKIKITPSTPYPASILVSNVIGVGVGELVLFGAVALAVVVGVEFVVDAVRVVRSTVGSSTVRPADVEVRVVVKLLVVREAAVVLAFEAVD